MSHGMAPLVGVIQIRLSDDADRGDIVHKMSTFAGSERRRAGVCSRRSPAAPEAERLGSEPHCSPPCPAVSGRHGLNGSSEIGGMVEIEAIGRPPWESARVGGRLPR